MIYAINYADTKFETNRRYNTKSAYKYGKVDKVIEYSPNSIDNVFFEENKKIFSYKRGNGLWLWKPYVILKTLNIIEDGDFLIYSDAGSYFVNNIRYLTDTMNKDGVDIMVFELPLLERQFTKKETFIYMDYMDFDQNQILSGYIVIRKNEKTISLIEEWLRYMKIEKIVAGSHFSEKVDEFPDFIAHREDQSVFSIVCKKYNITSYRDPSQFGDRPWQYASKERKVRIKEYPNSTYPRIIVSCRKTHPIKFRLKENIKTFLHKIGLWGQKSFFRKYNIPESQVLK